MNIDNTINNKMTQETDPQGITGANENIKNVRGTAPLPDGEFKLNAQEFAYLQKRARDMEIFMLPFNKFTSAIQMLEQKFLADGNLVYFYDEDVEYAKKDGEYQLDELGNKIPIGLIKGFFNKKEEAANIENN